MSNNDTDRKNLCRYYDSPDGCWFGDKCRFVHYNNMPPCKFYGSSTGCQFGYNCYFSHDNPPVKSINKHDEDYKENLKPFSKMSGTNNNSMETKFTINDQIDTQKMNFNDLTVRCGSCKQCIGEPSGTESYCTILKTHYLNCFLDKEGEHVKYLKFKAGFGNNQIYWCKTCCLMYDRPWSLFQHMADKTRSSKVNRWEKKVHLDWLDSIAGIIAGFDLGFFTTSKLKVDIRNLMTDFEDEIETAALSAMTMLQIFNPTFWPNLLRLSKDGIKRIDQDRPKTRPRITGKHTVPLAINNHPYGQINNEEIAEEIMVKPNMTLTEEAEKQDKPANVQQITINNEDDKNFKSSEELQSTMSELSFDSDL